MTKRHFFKGYVTSPYFDFCSRFYCLWISFISSQYKYICENICLFHNGNKPGFSIDLFISYYILKKHLWKFFCFSLLYKKHAWKTFFKNFFMQIFSLFMRFFALFKKIIQKNLNKSIDSLWWWVYCISVERQGR